MECRKAHPGREVSLAWGAADTSVIVGPVEPVRSLYSSALPSRELQIMMIQSVRLKRYAFAVAFGAVVLAYNPLADVFSLPADLRPQYVGAKSLQISGGDSTRKELTTMMKYRPADARFSQGDGRGTYQGTIGVFVCYNTDLNWADIAERNGDVRSHPVAWLDHFTETEGFRRTPSAKVTLT